MLRTALQPRSLALLALALVLATAFATLGSWQLDRSARNTEAPQQRTVDLTEVAQPQTALEGDALTADVRVEGVYDPQRQLEVVQRDLDGRPGRWVLTPMTVRSGSQDATLAVVRGWVADGNELPAPPEGQVEVVGRLLGSAQPTGTVAGLGPGQVRSVSVPDLLNLWSPPMYAGYLVVTDPVDPGLAAVPVPEPDGGGRNLLNISYALQWWVFAGFAVFLWWRIVADAHRHALEDAALEDAALEDADAQHAVRDAAALEDADGPAAGPHPAAGDNDATAARRGAPQ